MTASARIFALVRPLDGQRSALRYVSHAPVGDVTMAAVSIAKGAAVMMKLATVTVEAGGTAGDGGRGGGGNGWCKCGGNGQSIYNRA